MSVTYAKGFEAAGVSAGISAHEGKKDLALVVNQGPLHAAAGVFTSNRFCAAPVQWSRKAVADGSLHAVVINSGGANACTGEAGYLQSAKTAGAAATQLGLAPQEVAVASTGLIGDLLPMDNVLQGVEHAFSQLSDSKDAGTDASYAIMTTDTMPKTVTLDGTGYRIGGMVKGSGMIAPQLATMICVITTDAAIDAAQAEEALRQATSASFDRIDVDGCMSTNDTVLLLTSGASGVQPDMVEFSALIREACTTLARKIVGDGEGSSHDINVTVKGATSEDAALSCARAIAGANLLKCAIAGNDPNWGRVVSSLGTVPQATAPYDPNKVTVEINGVKVCDGGKPGEARSLVTMNEREVDITVDLHEGKAQGTIWTDDLTHDYVQINSEYES